MMKLLAWNISGLSNNPSVRRFKKLVKSHKISCKAIFEPKVCKNTSKDYKLKLKFSNYAANNEGNIRIFWSQDTKCKVLMTNAQHITSQIEVASICSYVSFVHASCDGHIWKIL